jgi:hypothetical protein
LFQGGAEAGYALGEREHMDVALTDVAASARLCFLYDCPRGLVQRAGEHLDIEDSAARRRRET